MQGHSSFLSTDYACLITRRPRYAFKEVIWGSCKPQPWTSKFRTKLHFYRLRGWNWAHACVCAGVGESAQMLALLFVLKHGIQSLIYRLTVQAGMVQVRWFFSPVYSFMTPPEAGPSSSAKVSPPLPCPLHTHGFVEMHVWGFVLMWVLYVISAARADGCLCHCVLWVHRVETQERWCCHTS
jgi:hypothetical protein